MRIYVESRGKKLDDPDYRLLDEQFKTLSENEKPLPYNKVMSLIRTDARSIVLIRCQKRLILLVAGLKSTRKDFHDREISNSILWLSKDAKEDCQLRAITIAALKDLKEENGKQERLFWEEVNDAVQTDDVKGFCFDPDKLSQIVSLPSVELLENQKALKGKGCQCKLAKLSSDRIGDLIEDLERGLPAGDGPLVVVTDNRSEDALREARVWRGLSNSVKSEDWEPIVDEELRKQVFFPIALLMMLVVTVLIAILVAKQINKEKPTITPEPQTINPTPEIPITCEEMIDPETQEMLPPCLTPLDSKLLKRSYMNS